MKVSIIIPVYNKAKTIEKTVSSILEQSLKDIQIVLVDDKSIDSSASTIEKLLKKDDRILLVKLENNSGPMYARMVGCNHAKGDYIVFCDADDIMPKSALEDLYMAIVSEGADVIFANMDYKKNDGTTYLRASLLPYGYDLPNIYKALLTWQTPHSLCAKIFRRSLFEGDFTVIMNQTHGEDGWMLYQVLEHSQKVRLLDKIVYSYIEDNNSTTHQMLSEATLIQMIRSNIGIFTIASHYPEIEAAAYRFFLRSYVSWCSSGFSWLEVNELLNKMSFSEITKNKCLFKYYSVSEAFSLIFEKYVKGLINVIRYRT